MTIMQPSRMSLTAWAACAGPYSPSARAICGTLIAASRLKPRRARRPNNNASFDSRPFGTWLRMRLFLFGISKSPSSCATMRSIASRRTHRYSIPHHHARLGVGFLEHGQEILERERNAAFRAGIIGSRHMEEDRTAESRHHGIVVVAERRQQIVDVIVAPEPLRARGIGQPDPAVVP